MEVMILSKDDFLSEDAQAISPGQRQDGQGQVGLGVRPVCPKASRAGPSLPPRGESGQLKKYSKHHGSWVRWNFIHSLITS